MYRSRPNTTATNHQGTTRAAAGQENSAQQALIRDRVEIGAGLGGAAEAPGHGAVQDVGSGRRREQRQASQWRESRTARMIAGTNTRRSSVNRLGRLIQRGILVHHSYVAQHSCLCACSPPSSC